MSCNKTLLGFDISSQQEACVKYRVNPVEYYLNCNIDDNPNQVIQCSAFTDSGCTTFLATNGYFAYDIYFRPYSPSTPNPGLYQRDFCLTSNYVKKCCDGDETVYKINNLSSYLNYVAPVGMILDLEVTDSNNFNVFRQCFEVVNPATSQVPSLTVNNLFGKYGSQDCESCKENNPNCFLLADDYTFTNCKTGKNIVLTVEEDNLFKTGDTVLFSGECYSLTGLNPISATTGVAGSILPNNCNNTLCNPIPPVLITSSFVSGCCDNKIYKLISGDEYPIGLTLSIGPDNFCYTVIPKQPPTVKFLSRNDLLGVIITDGCDSQECQPCPQDPTIQIPAGSTATPCEIITLFDMTIKCLSVNPTSTTLGILSVDVSGGTQPYSYIWTTPNGDKIKNKSTLVGIPEGTYEIEVIDKYGDYREKTFCSLTEIKDCSFQARINSIKQFDCNKTSAIQAYCYQQ